MTSEDTFFQKVTYIHDGNKWTLFWLAIALPGILYNIDINERSVDFSINARS